MYLHLLFTYMNNWNYRGIPISRTLDFSNQFWFPMDKLPCNCTTENHPKIVGDNKPSERISTEMVCWVTCETVCWVPLNCADNGKQLF